VFVEKVSNDTYLKVFDTNLTETPIKPLNSSVLNSGFKLNLDHENYSFDLGANAYENLTVSKNSDRFQFIMPYYNFSKTLSINDKNTLELDSSGSNNLIETNNLESNIINNLNFKLIDNISDFGFKNNFGIYFKNLNTIGKNNDKYKSSLQMELMNILEFNSSLPLGKTDSNYEYLIEPKISLRFNPGDMKNYNSTKRIINADNIFDINRLGLNDSFEGGQSLTIGVNYKKSNLDDINRYFETKISTVVRDKKQNLIPQSSTINNKNSNLFGSITYNHDDHFKFDYDFAIDNDLSTFNYNTISSEFTYENFTTQLKFIEERDLIGNTNSIENSFQYELDENNFLSFNTRRNRTINLTEYYDLLYEYKNDCLTAGFKYKKTYYQDRDLKPVEDLLFTITFYPLTTYEQEVDQNFYRGDNAFDDDIKKLFN
jgi:LPS-assembly protein